LWCDVSSWVDTLGRVPIEGDDVVVESGWNMYLDCDTPILNTLEINGRLTFRDDDNLDLTLNSKRIWVRSGELLIGTEDSPFRNTAKIVLHGN